MSRIFKSMRSALLIPFIGVVVLVAASISALSYRTGLQAVDQLSEQLLLDISNRVAQAMTKQLAASSVMLNAVAPSLPQGAPIQHPASLAPVTLLGFEQRMWIATNLFDEGQAYVYYGTDSGEFVGVHRDKKGHFELRIREGNATERSVHEVMSPGLAARGRVLYADNFDPRTRPWYRTAVERGRLTWSPVYVGFTTQTLTLTLAKPLYAADEVAPGAPRVLRGVVATDIPLTALAEFVRALQVSSTGVAFIVERDGTLIAASTTDKLFSNDAKPTTTRLRADQSASPLVRQAYAQLQENLQPTRVTVGDVAVAHYSFDSTSANGRVHMSATAQRDAAGLDWTMVVAIPRADHMGDVQRKVIENVLIGLLAVGLAIAAGLWVMQRVTGDVHRLSEATRLLARGHSPERLFPERHDELGVIAKAMEEFKEGLLTDPLTGTLTRSTFEKRFANYIAAHPDVKLALVFVDLDRFKRINDQYGHAAGDTVLSICAQRIASVMRKDDLLARFGGDEFVMLLPGVTSDETLNRQIARVTTALDQPIAVADASVFVRGSCGGALFNRDGDSLDQLLNVADGRMYEAKRARNEANLG